MFKNKYAEVERTKHHYFLFVVTKVSTSRSCSCAMLILRIICVHDNVTRAAIRSSTETTDQCSSIDNSAGRHMTLGAGQGDTRCRLRKTARNASHVSGCRDWDSNLLSLKHVFQSFVWISEQTAIISLNSINWLVCITETVCV
jgi:hypothetical protein